MDLRPFRLGTLRAFSSLAWGWPQRTHLVRYRLGYCTPGAPTQCLAALMPLGRRLSAVRQLRGEFRCSSFLSHFKLGASRRIDPRTSMPLLGGWSRETAWGASRRNPLPQDRAGAPHRPATASTTSPSRPGTAAGHLRVRGRRPARNRKAYGLSDSPDTFGAYAGTWTERHPRSKGTNATNDHRIGRSGACRSRAWP